MRRQKLKMKLLGFLFVILLLGFTSFTAVTVSISYQEDNENNIATYIGQASSKMTKLSKNSRNYKLLILTFTGDEGTLALDALNDLTNLIYWHHPLQIWDRIHKKTSGNQVNIRNEDILHEFEARENINETMYGSSGEFLTEVFDCRFSSKIRTFFYNAAKYSPYEIKYSRQISELLECQTINRVDRCNYTSDITGKLNSLCKSSNRNVIVKLNEKITPNFKEIWNTTSNKLDAEINLLHIIRDPRAVFYDMAMHGRIPLSSYREDFVRGAGFVCKNAEKNLKFIKQNWNNSRQYQRMYFEVLTDVKEVLQTFVELPQDNSVKFEESRRTARSQRLADLRFESLGDSWRSKISIELASSTENYCWQLFVKHKYVFAGFNQKLIRGNESLIEKNGSVNTYADT